MWEICKIIIHLSGPFNVLYVRRENNKKGEILVQNQTWITFKESVESISEES